jgi:voltage-gated potassium channel
MSSVFIIIVLMFASSLGIYNVEHEAQPEVFRNAFSGIWWSVSAMLTVGYGDIYPITVVGQIMAICIAFLGVGVVAIPTGIISAGFLEKGNERKDKKTSEESKDHHKDGDKDNDDKTEESDKKHYCPYCGHKLD